MLAEPQKFQPGECWADNRGRHIQAHGGGLIKLGDTFYWFGEDRSQDYLDIAQDVCLVRQPLEGGAIVHYGDRYYFVGSQLTGWKANPNKYATARLLAGPWSEFNEIAPESTNTYGSQSTMLLKVDGNKNTVVIFMADKWKPNAQ